MTRFNPRSRPSVAARFTATLCALAVLGSAAWMPAYAQANLPALGDSVSDDLSVGTERKLGDQIMRSIRQDPDYLDDPVLLEYLQSIWQPLVAAARAQGNIGAETDQRFAWEPFLVRDKTVNAFALPGGFVGVHLGLIAMTATRDELASVLAHEMTHVTQRHIARGMVNSRRQSLLGLAGMILGVLAATRSNRTDGANAIFTGAQAASVQGQLNFSRDMEREADRIGFGVLTGAGFAPGGMAAMFEKLDQASHLNDSGGFPYLRTHPITTERIGDARQRLGTAAPVPPVSVLAHVAAQARARVMMDPRTDALRRAQSQDSVAPNAGVAERLNSAYASALASTMLRDWARADAALQVALGLVRGSPRSDAAAEREVVMLQAQSLAERGDGPRAAQVLKPYLEAGSPPSRAVLLLQAQVALASPKADPTVKRSADDLQTWTTLHPADALAWQQLSRTWEQLGERLRSLRADAEAHYAVGDLTGAVDRLRAGQRLARTPGGKVDFIDASIIDARLRDLEVQRRRQMEEDRRQEG